MRLNGTGLLSRNVGRSIYDPLVGEFDQLFANLDPDPRVRGKQFERICKWYLENDPTYVERLRHVWLWLEWEDRWSDTEAGIDLVAEDVDGKLWAIQAKGYGEDKPIPKRELDKFLSESSRKQFSYRLLISTTTNGLHHIAQETVAAQEKPVFLRDLSDLRNSPVPWHTHPDDLSPPPPLEPAQPRDHQLDAIRDVVDGFGSADRGQLIMACGTGKTLTSWFITEKLTAERTLMLVPSLSLLKQTMCEWQNASGGVTRFASLPVCSDASVSSTDDFAVAYTADLGVPVTTDPEAIAAFLRKRGPRVVFSTYQSSPQIAKAFEIGGVPSFDLVVADEAHRVAGPVKTDFATVLDGTRIEAKRRLFMTATPRVYSASTKRAAEDEDFEYASMDDHTKFGEVFHRLSFGEAIERKLLTDYQVAIIGVDDATYHEWTQRGTFVTIDGKTPTPANKVAGQIGLAKAMHRFNLRRTISFHSRVSRAKDFAASMQTVIDWMPPGERPSGELWARYASGEMDAGKRSRLIKHLANLKDGERGLLSNARCLAEGVDVPTLDGVAFIDPRRSEVDIVQAVGRAIRKSENKKLGTIVIPVFIKDDTDPETALKASSFQRVWDVLRALRSHDDELSRQLDELRREMGRYGGTPTLPAKIYSDIPKSVGPAFADAFCIRLVEQTTFSWEFWYGLLEKYVEDRGTSRVPHPEVIDGFALGGWVSKQRGRYNAGTLPIGRQRRLESLPDWSWAALHDRWEESFDQLRDYVEENGTAVVPHSCVWKGFRLGSWINKQRGDYNDGTIDPARRSRLEELPRWSWDVNEHRWERGFKYLTSYVAEHGDAQVPADYVTADGYNLGKWVFKQRTNHRKGVLDADRIRRLEALAGWSWQPHVDRWEGFYSALAEYAELTGSADVSSKLNLKGMWVGVWVRNQRALKNRGELEPERASRLERLPGWRWKRDFVAEKWEEGIQHLEAYVEQNGHCRVPDAYQQDGYNLGPWVQKQRSLHQKGKLDPAYARRLAALVGWSWESVRDEKWETGFHHVEEYVKEHGHARIPAKCVFNEYGLGTWVNSQRTRYISGALEVGRVRRLEAIPGWIWDARADVWEEGFQHLLHYVEEHGDARVLRPYVVGDYRLGQWVGIQRSNNNKGTLTHERQQRLEELPGWSWDLKTDAWEEGFQKLLEFVADKGTSRVPQSYSTEGFRLGSWVNTQRQAHADATLDPTMAKRLEALPRWSWNPRDDAWDEGLQRLAEYMRKHPESPTPTQAYKEPDGYKLGSWVVVQRTAYDKGTLSEERQRRLESLTGWSWDPLADAWDGNYGRLLDYVKTHGTSRVPPKYTVDGFRLGAWVQKQRSVYAAGRLGLERQHRLEALPKWRWSRYDP